MKRLRKPYEHNPEVPEEIRRLAAADPAEYKRRYKVWQRATHPEHCRERDNLVLNTAKSKKLSEGLCQSCGQRTPAAGRKRCEDCIAAQRQYLDQRVAAGICIVCPAHHTTGKRRCPACVQALSDYYKQRYNDKHPGSAGTKGRIKLRPCKHCGADFGAVELMKHLGKCEKNPRVIARATKANHAA